MNKSKLFLILLLGLSIAGCTTPDEVKNTYTISGKVGFPGNVFLVEPFTINLILDDHIIATTTDPIFTFSGLAEGKSYTVIPTSSNYSRNGISSLDLVVVTKYINGEVLLSPFQKLAADMNSDHLINQTDTDLIVSCIVGGDECPSWRFASEDYDGNGLGYVDQFTATKLNADLEVNFIPVKIGDVNNTISIH